MQLSTTLQKDYVASNIRAQLIVLRTALEGLERAESVDNDFLHTSLKEVESSIRRLRRTYA